MGFPVLKDVGCMSLKTGCLLIGSMGIISSILGLFALLIMFLIGAMVATFYQSAINNDSNSYRSSIFDDLDDGSGKNPFESQSVSDFANSFKLSEDSKQTVDDLTKAIATVWIISMIVYAVISFGTMISSSCLVHGVRKGTPGLLTPFLIFAPFVLILWLVLIIVPSVMLSTVATGNIAPTIIWLGVVGFFWVVVYSHKKELSNPNYQHTDYARAGNTEGAVHYNVQQPGVQYNVPPQYNVQQPGVQYNVPPQYNVQQPGVQYNVPPQGVQYNVPPQGVQYNMPPQGVQYNAPQPGVQYKA